MIPLVIVVLLGAGGSYIYATRGGTPVPPATAAPREPSPEATPREAVPRRPRVAASRGVPSLEMLVASVVLVEGVGVDVGTGFLIERDRVLSLRPLVEGASEIVVTRKDGKTSPASALEPPERKAPKGRGGTSRQPRWDPADVLVVLKLAEPWDDLHPVALRTSRELRSGAPVSAVGFPVGATTPVVTKGIVSAPKVSLPGLPIPLVQMDASVNPGQWGGPVLDEEGSAIGIIAGRLEGLDGMNYALPGDLGVRAARAGSE